MLEEHKAALETAGYQVTLVTTKREATRLGKSGSFDAAILGHTLQKTDRDELVNAIKSVNHEACIILFYYGSIDGVETADAALSFFAPPADVVQSVNHLLMRTEARRMKASLRPDAATSGK